MKACLICGRELDHARAEAVCSTCCTSGVPIMELSANENPNYSLSPDRSDGFNGRFDFKLCLLCRKVPTQRRVSIPVLLPDAVAAIAKTGMPKNFRLNGQEGYLVLAAVCAQHAESPQTTMAVAKLVIERYLHPTPTQKELERPCLLCGAGTTLIGLFCAKNERLKAALKLQFDRAEKIRPIAPELRAAMAKAGEVGAVLPISICHSCASKDTVGEDIGRVLLKEFGLPEAAGVTGFLRKLGQVFGTGGKR